MPFEPSWLKDAEMMMQSQFNQGQFLAGDMTRRLITEVRRQIAKASDLQHELRRYKRPVRKTKT